ncbi:MAG: cupin domain-containing protein [Eubacteriales bacterium]|nr:cupin domain-containing protein [Eubacteriales bacterium]
MIIKSEEMQSKPREGLRGGSGTTGFLHIVPAEALPGKVRLFSLISLEKGCSVGDHKHEGETEVYYVLEGEGVLNDNGTIRPFRKGDCNVCGGGEAHGVMNEKDETLKMIAVIVLD